MDFYKKLAIQAAIHAIMPIASAKLEENLKKEGITAEVKITVKDIDYTKIVSETDNKGVSDEIIAQILKDLEGNEE